MKKTKKPISIERICEKLEITDSSEISEVKRIVDEQYEVARNLLTQNRDMLEYISKTLLDEETIDEKRFVELMEKVESDRG